MFKPKLFIHNVIQGIKIHIDYGGVRTRITGNVPIQMLIFSITCILLASALSLSAHGYANYGGSISGPLSGDCDVCHAPGDVSSLNPYGVDFRSIATYDSDPGGAIAGIGHLDSDGDGYNNTVELQSGTYPGDGNDNPSVAKVPELSILNLTKSSMHKHVGEKILIYSSIRNSGAGDAYNVTASLYDGDLLVETLSGITIEDSETETVLYKVYPSEEGSHKFTLVVKYSEGTLSEHIYVHVLPVTKELPAPSAVLLVLLSLSIALLIRARRHNNG